MFYNCHQNVGLHAYLSHRFHTILFIKSENLEFYLFYNAEIFLLLSEKIIFKVTDDFYSTTCAVYPINNSKCSGSVVECRYLINVCLLCRLSLIAQPLLWQRQLVAKVFYHYYMHCYCFNPVSLLQ